MGTQRKFRITNGPNRSMLFDACRFAYDRQVVIPIQFVVTHFTRATDDTSKKNLVVKLVTDVKIIGIEHESGDGQTFNIHGHCKVDIRPLEDEDRHYAFKARYNAQSREGYIALE